MVQSANAAKKKMDADDWKSGPQKVFACMDVYIYNSFLRIRRYCHNLKKSSKEIQEMYDKESSSTQLRFPLHVKQCVAGCSCVACIHCLGAELKKIFLESGGNFDLVEMQVKKWTESKKTGIDTESRVTKRQLKEKYFWDDARA